MGPSIEESTSFVSNSPGARFTLSWRSPQNSQAWLPASFPNLRAPCSDDSAFVQGRRESVEANSVVRLMVCRDDYVSGHSPQWPSVGHHFHPQLGVMWTKFAIDASQVGAYLRPTVVIEAVVGFPEQGGLHRGSEGILELEIARWSDTSLRGTSGFAQQLVTKKPLISSGNLANDVRLRTDGDQIGRFKRSSQCEYKIKALVHDWADERNPWSRPRTTRLEIPTNHKNQTVEFTKKTFTLRHKSQIRNNEDCLELLGRGVCPF